MLQLTLRTLLAYIDDTLEPSQARELGQKVAESELARDLIERIKKVTRRRGLQNPAPAGAAGDVSDPNTVAEYLSDNLESEQSKKLEATCLDSDAHLAEIAACHQILTLVLTEPVRVPPQANQRMYKLVPPPASDPNRRPGKAVPVGGVTPATSDRTESDDHDAGLLLGMGRYGSGSSTSRFAVAATVAVLGVMLIVAVVMALRHDRATAPETAPGLLVAAGPAPAALPKPPDEQGKSSESKPKPPDTPKPKPPDTPKPKPKGKESDIVSKVPAPRVDRAPLGKMTSLNVLVVSRTSEKDPWLRLDPAAENGVNGMDDVLCLPGFKADVALDSGVTVHFWGNVAEQLPSRLAEVRVSFHAPPRKSDGVAEDFDADLTLFTGRIYLSSSKPGGARIRVRIASEVWDFTLAEPKTDVLVEVVTAFEPGSPFALEGGPPPRTEARAAVLHGSAAIKAPNRPADYPKVDSPAVISWDSKSGQLIAPQPIPTGNPYFEKFQQIPAAQGLAIQKALSDLTTGPIKRDGVRIVLLQRLTEPPDLARAAVTLLAVYGQAAIASGAEAGNELKPLIDILTEETRGYARLAVVKALSTWIAQTPGNTRLLYDQLTAKLLREKDAELICRLLRGYVAVNNPDPAALDQLVEFLNDPSVAVRELALWNLVFFADPEGPKAGLIADVAVTGPGSGYDQFVTRWKTRVAEIKKGTPPPKK